MRRSTIQALASLAIVSSLGACKSKPDGPKQEGQAPLASASASIQKASPPPSTKVRAPAEAAGDAVTAFATDLHRVWWSDPAHAHETSAIAPLSIAGSLALAHAGARGETARSLASVLHLAGLKDVDLITLERTTTAGFEIDRATRVFVDPSVLIDPAYRGLVARQGSIATAPFATSTDAARSEVNRWVAGATKKRIETVLPPGAVDASTRVVLVDALSVHARWATAFDPKQTTPREFFGLDGQRSEVAMMTTEHAFRHVNGDGFQLVEIPFADQAHALLVALPDRDHFDAVAAAVDPGELDRSVRSVAPEKIVLSMPRFRAELPAHGMKAELASLGLESVFGDRADWSGMTKSDLRLDDIHHAAMIEVDELGAKMAAATAGVIRLPAPVPAITLDRPFLFWVTGRTARDTPIILMMGRFMGP